MSTVVTYPHGTYVRSLQYGAQFSVSRWRALMLIPESGNFTLSYVAFPSEILGEGNFEHVRMPLPNEYFSHVYVGS